MNKIFKTFLSICLLLCFSFALTACGDAKFECSGKYFVYDNWEARVEMDDIEMAEINAYVLSEYAAYSFEFNEDGTFVWYEGTNIYEEGTWNLMSAGLVLAFDGDTYTCEINGARFSLSEGAFVIYYKVS